MIAGNVGFRDLGDGACEVRRLFVRPKARGQGIARALMTTLIDEARQAGYRTVRLETLEAMREAQALYQSLGFVPITAYRPPAGDHDRTVSMQLVLL